MVDTTTLDGMTVETLREIAKRATATASAKEAEQAEAKKRVEAAKKAERDAKDIIPGADGTVWEYGGRYWTVDQVVKHGDRLLLSIDVTGGPVRGWWCSTRFSQAHIPENGGWEVASRVKDEGCSLIGIAKLALRVTFDAKHPRG